ncbi:MAG: DUF362 domain-containing protein [Candidatus Aminicenantes bacterium]|nr:DUF362 domain-containing protein [Candidatus Aminicenantes bacterium]
MKASRVIIVRGRGVLSPRREVDQKKLLQMYERGFRALTGQPDLREGFRSFFHDRDRLGLKINTIAGRELTSVPDVTLGLAKLLAGKGSLKKNIIIWDRTNRELRASGYSLNLRQGIQVFGTDTEGVGYDPTLVSHLNIGSRLSSIQAQHITASISFAILKDHGLAGVTAGMKNYFGAIHNPNKYHDFNCNPFVAELFDTQPIKNKHKLSILDCMVVQYHRGPSFHSRWAEHYNALLFSFDPVAADVAGWQIIEKLRAKKGLPSLREEDREPEYLFTAAKMGLGTAEVREIQTIEEEV